MRKLVMVLCAALLLVPCVAGTGCGDGAPEPPAGLTRVAEFEGGYLYRAGKIHVARLSGSYHAMGRQYGGLMKTRMKEFYSEAVDGFFSSHKQLPRAQVEAVFTAGYAVYPARVREILEGMKQTSGLTIGQLVMIDSAFALPIVAGDMAGCSMAATWKEYTGGGPLVYGRSFDYAPSFRKYNDTLSVVVYNPDDGSRSTAAIVNAGQVGTLSAFNDAGLTMSANLGTISGGQDILEDTTTTLVNNLTFMLDASNLQALIAELKTARPIFAFIYNVADRSRAVSIEETTTQYRQRNGSTAGLLVATNHFVEPSWNLPTTSSGGNLAHPLWKNTTARYEGLVNLCEQNKGRMNADTMKQIFDTPMDKGGPVQPDTTIYEFVSVPAEQQLWVKAYGYQDWVLVRLGGLFDTAGPDTP